MVTSQKFRFYKALLNFSKHTIVSNRKARLEQKNNILVKCCKLEVRSVPLLAASKMFCQLSPCLIYLNFIRTHQPYPCEFP